MERLYPVAYLKQSSFKIILQETGSQNYIHYVPKASLFLAYLAVYLCVHIRYIMLLKYFPCTEILAAMLVHHYNCLSSLSDLSSCLANVGLLQQNFSDTNVNKNHHWILLKCRLWINRSGRWGNLRFCVSNKLPDDANVGPLLWVARVSMTLSLFFLIYILVPMKQASNWTMLTMIQSQEQNCWVCE